MTTIVYDHNAKLIACDSMVTKGDRVLLSSTYEKWREDETGIYFFYGRISDIDLFMSLSKGKGTKPNDKMMVSALRVDKAGRVFDCGYCNDHGYFETPLDYSVAVGSGEDFAISALDFGKSAYESVKYASTRCIYTGGKVRLYSVTKQEFMEY